LRETPLKEWPQDVQQVLFLLIAWLLEVADFAQWPDRRTANPEKSQRGKRPKIPTRKLCYNWPLPR